MWSVCDVGSQQGLLSGIQEDVLVDRVIARDAGVLLLAKYYHQVSNMTPSMLLTTAAGTVVFLPSRIADTNDL